ncbi:MAG: MarR family transcriptional regulator [Chloroflexi bacterium]|nr:MarR family transcriptional regulator [Chloroflexota bacterium]
MLPPKQFTQVLHEWAEVFMRRSMRDFILFTKDTGLSNPQISTLMRLYYRGACGVSDIGSHTGVTNAAASQMVERLVQNGLLERTEDPRDRRVKQLTLTKKGRTLIEKGIEARRRWLEELTTALTEDQQTEIITALTYLTEAARKLESPES